MIVCPSQSIGESFSMDARRIIFNWWPSDEELNVRVMCEFRGFLEISIQWLSISNRSRLYLIRVILYALVHVSRFFINIFFFLDK